MLDRTILRKIRDYFLKEEGRSPEGSLVKVLRGNEIKTISHAFRHSQVSDTSIALVWALRECDQYDEVYNYVTWAGYCEIANTGKSFFFRGKKAENESEDFKEVDEVEFINNSVVYYNGWSEEELDPCFKKLKRKIEKDLGYVCVPEWLRFDDYTDKIICDRLDANALQNLIPTGVLVDKYFDDEGSLVHGDFLLERDGKLRCVFFANNIIEEDYPACLFHPDDLLEPVEVAHHHYTDSLRDGDLIWGIRIMCVDVDDHLGTEKILFKHPILFTSDKEEKRAA